MSDNNPLLKPFETPFGVPPFHEIKLEHYKPAIEELIEKSLEEIDGIANNPDEPTFENTIMAMDRTGKHLEQVFLAFSNLNSAETSDEMQALANELSPIMTEYANKISQNEALFARVKKVYETAGVNDPEDLMLLTKSYKGFVRSGANLNAEDKTKYRELSMELAQLGLKFGENVLAETNGYELILEDEKDLQGLPDGIQEAAAQSAKEKGYEGKWLFTLQAPSFIPFMEYAENRELREKLYRAYMSKCFKGDDLDNQEVVKKIVKLRNSQAALLGYDSHADYVLEERMAESSEKVNAFLNDMLEKALPKAKEEIEEVKTFAKSKGLSGEFQRWDWAFYSRMLKDEKFQLNDELLRPYFKLENCVQGIFDLAEKLFGLKFTLLDDVPVYHDEVSVYDVVDEKGDHIAVFYADFFPRAGKRGGAWMTAFRDQWVDEVDHRPIASIVCNFTKPTETKPSLLTYNEVETLFHEFGHALHGMLSQSKHSALSCTNVYWDFVELPSQILENWVKEKECLDLFAKHYETGEAIPEEYIQRINDADNFLEGYQTIRQISFGLMDMAWHSLKADEIEVDSVSGFEQKAMAATELFPAVEGACMSTQFSHIFQGGYAAGYYSYKWAEVLDADAFSLFKQNGIFDQETATSFKDNILSKGGTAHPMELYKKFRGQEPTVDALLERAGLK